MDEQQLEKLANSLSRCAFLLERISQGDHQALENAEAAWVEARVVLLKAGYVIGEDECEQDSS